MSLDVKAEGLTEVVIRLKSMPDQIRKSIGRAVYGESTRLVSVIRDEVLPALPIKKGESYERYANSIFRDIQEGPSSMIAEVGTRGVILSSKYGQFNLAAGLEYGTVAHIIRARFAKALAFMLGGTLTFRQQVNHPGTKAYYPITGSLEREAPAIRAALEAAASEALK